MYLQMQLLSHPNLAKFVGACLDPGNILILMEYCPRGSLQVRDFTSGKHSREINTPLYPTFIYIKKGYAGYTYFSHFCPKT